MTQRLTSKITSFEYPFYFRDEMLKGAFKMVRHDHIFEEYRNATIMKDKFEYEVPAGIIGKAFNWLILEKYLRRLLEKRNQMLKEVAEGQRWKTILL